MVVFGGGGGVGLTGGGVGVGLIGGLVGGVTASSFFSTDVLGLVVVSSGGRYVEPGVEGTLKKLQ